MVIFYCKVTMKRYDLVSSLFWMMFGILIIIGLYVFQWYAYKFRARFSPPSYRGSLTILSTILFFISVFRNTHRRESVTRGYTLRNSGIEFSTIFALLIYSITFRWLGFPFATFLLMAFLFKGIGKLVGRFLQEEHS